MYQGGYLIGQISKLTGRKINELLKAYGVEEFNGAQGTILYSLWNRDGLTIKEISKITGLAKTTLASMLQRMEENGLIEYTENPQDRRSKIIRLTEKSKGLETVYHAVSDEMIGCYYDGFRDEEIREFENTLERVLKNIEKYKSTEVKNDEG